MRMFGWGVEFDSDVACEAAKNHGKNVLALERGGLRQRETRPLFRDRSARLWTSPEGYVGRDHHQLRRPVR